MTGSSSKSSSLYLATLIVAAFLLRATLILILSVSLALALACVTGCGSRTIFVPEESPMRVGPQSRLRVYHRIDGTWTLSNNRIEIPEGWYLVPPSFVKE